MCNHKNAKEYKCEFCELEKVKYYGYDPQIYNLAYDAYCIFTNKVRQSTYRRLCFTHTKYFKEFYHSTICSLRADKIKSLYEK